MRTWNMTAKGLGAYRPARPINVSAESMFSEPVGKTQKAVLARIEKRQAAGDDSGIDYSDIPALTDAQLAEFNGELSHRLASLDRGEPVDRVESRARLQRKSAEGRKPRA